jgi:hypothetical protein
MTTANGTYKLCDSDNYVAIVLTCSGPHCSGLQGNLTCTQPDAGYWICNNNRTCTGSSSIISNFTLNQPNVAITEIQYLLINGTNFVLTQDESGNITVANGTVAPSQSPGTSATTTAQSHSSTTQSFALRHASSWHLLIFISVLALMAVQANAQKIPCISEVINGTFNRLARICASISKAALLKPRQDLLRKQQPWLSATSDSLSTRASLRSKQEPRSFSDLSSL